MELIRNLIVYKLKTPVVLNTDGKGLWSNVDKPVKVTSIEVHTYEDETFGEMRVFFDTKSWDIDRFGLIYTDKLFEKELFQYLSFLGVNCERCGYSEQGMQGDDYVSLDVGEKFIKSFSKVV
jgi:hypothetical protein